MTRSMFPRTAGAGHGPMGSLAARRMNGDALRVRVIEGRGSWRTHALNAFLRFASRTPLRQDSDIAALRRR